MCPLWYGDFTDQYGDDAGKKGKGEIKAIFEKNPNNGEWRKIWPAEVHAKTQAERVHLLPLVCPPS